MGFLIDDLPDYNFPNQPTGPDPKYVNSIEEQSRRANRPIGAFQGDLNQGLDQSNLMGPGDPSNPESDALSARGKQMYDSDLNLLMRKSAVPAAQYQTQLQTQNLAKRAAVYSNTQTNAQIQWQQISYQREAAITQEATRRQLYGALFGGIGSIAGAFAAKGLYNANHPTGIEMPSQSRGQMIQNFSDRNNLDGTMFADRKGE